MPAVGSSSQCQQSVPAVSASSQYIPHLHGRIAPHRYLALTAIALQLCMHTLMQMRVHARASMRVRMGICVHAYECAHKTASVDEYACTYGCERASE